MHISVNRFPLDANGTYGETSAISDLEKADINIAFGDVAAVTALAGASKTDKIGAGTRWIASSSCLGAMSHLGTDKGESCLHVLSVANIDGGAGVASAELVPGKARSIAEQTLVHAMQDAGRLGEMPSLVWLIVAPGTEEEVLNGLHSVLGDGVPIFGGSSADNSIEGKWVQFDGRELHHNGIVVAVLYMSEPVSCYFSSGYEPTELSAQVTAGEGRTVYTLDGEPAGTIYNRWLNLMGQTPLKPGNILQASTYFPISRQQGAMSLGVPLLSHPARLNNDGSIELFASLEVGEQITLMSGQPENLIRRATEVTEVVLRTHELNYECRPKALIIVFCGGCMLAVKEHLDEIQRSLLALVRDVPFIMGFTFGEQGCFSDGISRHGNLMISATAIG
ncbi:MAG: FIST N-terminal domain-containing protein [Pseudomonadota bacterium]|nr:FIST N-terminal domain-containing protein [Pseudomonadota bacterium]